MKTLNFIILILTALLTMSMTQREKQEDLADLIIHNNTNDTILHY